MQPWDMFDEASAPHDDYPWLRESIALVRPYLEEFLVSRHPLRAGPVCPFMPSALRAHQVFFAVGDIARGSRVESRRTMDIARTVWAGEKGKFRYSALVILYPTSSPSEFVSEVQRRAKVAAIREGLMVGALFAGNNAESVHGDNYFPLRTPVPTVVYRDMVPFDLLFLNEPRFSARRRAEFLRRYIEQYENAKYGWEREGIESARTQLQECEHMIRRGERVRAVAVSLGAAVVARAVPRWIAVKSRRLRARRR
ncbi:MULTISPECIES: DUF6875 domain-containing protein [unclassified Microbacterium]|uniref:DUF6875 domain-containing protein n=1 Tax=unclassified Microbacterium TaxID=2609290 RepID=UPI003427D660